MYEQDRSEGAEACIIAGGAGGLSCVLPDMTNGKKASEEQHMKRKTTSQTSLLEIKTFLNEAEEM